MPCNPAIGGTAKGHLVREIDALGGLMGRAIDATGIQFKLLNRSRGPAVWSPRAQADKRRYGAWVREALSAQPNITWLFRRAGRDARRRTAASRGLAFEDGDAVSCRALVVTTGTFLNGLVHIGDEQRPAGRAGEPPTRELAESLRGLRLRDGPAQDRHAAAAAIGAASTSRRFAAEHGDDPIVPFSFMSGATRARNRSRVTCVHTTTAVHELVRASIGRSPLYNGQITGIGPRYCPSLEDKVMRFPDKERHQIFLEPEGLDVDEIYVNGLSMSLPRDVQEAIVHALPGLEDARDPAARVCGRIRLHSADRARSIARNQADSRAVSRRPDQRHVRLRRGRRAGTDRRPERRASRRERERPSCSNATRPTSAFSSTTS